jgi:heme exporter protein B
VRQIFALLAKDLLVEWRSRARASAVFFFALAILVVVSFATAADDDLLRKIAGATLWIGVLVASTRSLDQSMTIELENGALEGMVLLPVHPMALFYGKALSNTLTLLLVVTALLPLTIAMFDVPMRGSWAQLAAVLVLGSGAIAAPGTLYAAITNRVRGAAVLLPVLLFPLVVPALVAATRGTTVILDGDAMGDATLWLGLLTGFNVIHWSVSGLLFSRLVEEG